MGWVFLLIVVSKRNQIQVYFVAKNMDKLLKVHFSSSPLSYSSLFVGQ